MDSNRSGSGEEEEKPEIYYYYTRQGNIQPNNERTKKKMEELRDKEQEKKEKAHQQQQARKALEQQNKAKDKQIKERLKAEEERKKIESRKYEEEQRQLSDLKGSFGISIQQLRRNETNLEMVMTGVDYNLVQRRLIYKAIERNTSLKNLVINRKGMRDDEGVDLVRALKYNRSLEKLSLESNQLGPGFLDALAETLKFNKTLKYIDLEGNPLTEGNKEYGIEALFDALKTNDTLFSLSLNSTSLTEKAGATILNTLNYNKKLILLDIEKNPGIKLDTVRKIQLKLMENNRLWREVRTKEWNERKKLKDEEDNTKMINRLRKEENETIRRILKEAREDQAKREELWIQEMRTQKEDRMKIEKKIQKEALARGKKKKRRRKKKKS